MRTHGITRTLALTAVTILVASCATGPSTSIVKAERLADIPAAPYANVLVVGVARDHNNARRFENALAEDLIEGGTIATAGSAAGMEGVIDEAAVRDAVRRLQADAVVVSSVKQVEYATEVREGQEGIRADRKDGGLANFFRYDYADITAPVTLETSVDVVVTTDVYDTASGLKAYTLETRTIKAETPFEVIMGETRAIAAQLRRDAIIR